MNRYRAGRRRAGSVLVFVAVIMVMLFAMLAFAVDVGYVTLVRTELQTAADSAALAATWELLNARSATPDAMQGQVDGLARDSARQYAQLNPVAQMPLNVVDADINVGRMNLSAGALPRVIYEAENHNAVRVIVRRSDELNGEVPSFFIRVVGVKSFPSQAEATAAFIDNFSGFNIPPDGKGNLNILPFALDKGSWDVMLAGQSTDYWTWDEATNEVRPGPDGIKETNLYPQGTGSAGNRGTVDIGGNNNSTADVSRQILEGANAEDLESLGGKLELGPDGTLALNGDTGISAGVKDELASIIGKPRIIPLFSAVEGPGNNTQYTIVGFAGVRIMEVQLSGHMGGKRVVVQPARVDIYGGIPRDDQTQHTYFLYSPVWLVQ